MAEKSKKHLTLASFKKATRVCLMEHSILQVHYGTMENINQKKHQRDDLDKKESTSSGENDDVPSTSSKPKEFIHDDVCSICMDDVRIHVGYKDICDVHMLWQSYA